MGIDVKGIDKVDHVALLFLSTAHKGIGSYRKEHPELSDKVLLDDNKSSDIGAELLKALTAFKKKHRLHDKVTDHNKPIIIDHAIEVANKLCELLAIAGDKKTFGNKNQWEARHAKPGDKRISSLRNKGKTMEIE